MFTNKHPSAHYAREPVWRLRGHMIGKPVPENMACWLFDRGSLTRRLIQHCQGNFSVRVVSQGWQQPMHNEMQRLDQPMNRLALVRQVYLFCDAQPWVFARTVIPNDTLTGPRRHLARLGSKPLGAVLFADPNMQRDEVEIASIRKGNRMFDTATLALQEPASELWGRRSVFYIAGKPLLVNEVFLPGISQCRQMS